MYALSGLRWFALFCVPAVEAVITYHERREVQLHGVSRGDRIEESAVIPVRIALTQSNIDRGYEYLMNVSHPASAHYGAHWTYDEVANHFAPSQTSVRVVRQWLQDFGVGPERVHQRRGWLAFAAPAKEVARLLKTEFHEYHVAQDSTLRIGCEKYSVPSLVAPHIDFITPGVDLSAPLKLQKPSSEGGNSPTSAAQIGPQIDARSTENLSPRRGSPQYGQLAPDLRLCGFNITPTCLRTLYNIPKHRFSEANNALGLLEFADAFLQQDLDSFFTKHAPFVPNGTQPDIVSIDGGIGVVTAPNALIRAETEVDLEVAYSLIYPQNVTVYEVGRTGLETFVDTFLDAIDSSYCSAFDKLQGFQCSSLPLTKVLSTSVTSPELGLSVKAVRRACNEFMKLSLQGHTIVFNSGDYGVGSNPPTRYPDSDGCVAVTANGTLEVDRPDARTFNPQFPNVCPYVLSVGGTMLYPNDTVYDKESALNIPTLSPYPNAQFSSGGGFANYFRRPAYQDAAVEEYLNSYDPGYDTYEVGWNGSGVGNNGGSWNRNGRGIPDVAANGNNFLGVVNGTEHPYHGTSISAPIWASIITLLNEERAKVGKGPVGFVNAVLYAHPEVFNDITNGTNPGCGTPGFAAVKGWDPVTGLGTPNFEKLRSLFMRLP